MRHLIVTMAPVHPNTTLCTIETNHVPEPQHMNKSNQNTDNKLYAQTNRGSVCLFPPQATTYLPHIREISTYQPDPMHSFTSRTAECPRARKCVMSPLGDWVLFVVGNQTDEGNIVLQTPQIDITSWQEDWNRHTQTVTPLVSAWGVVVSK